MNTHQSIILSMLPPWVGVGLAHLVDTITLQNIATVASIAYCCVGVFVMLRKK
ncbi:MULTISPECIES: hypothetical protein [Burkholderia]|uniref:hypothetical protein n=1 Tax=Burkholderia TaxID=32008 RepID=UPI0015A6B441|nr:MULTISPECIES: hypothetical protein [Burkholderia]